MTPEERAEACVNALIDAFDRGSPDYQPDLRDHLTDSSGVAARVVARFIREAYAAGVCDSFRPGSRARVAATLGIPPAEEPTPEAKAELEAALAAAKTGQWVALPNVPIVLRPAGPVTVYDPVSSEVVVAVDPLGGPITSADFDGVRQLGARMARQSADALITRLTAGDTPDEPTVVGS